VVTVCLNARQTIETTLRSVREQSFGSIEHVVIDGGSTDGTGEIVQTYGPAYFVSEPDNGLYYAMQKGAAAATGDIVFFLNSGDVFFDETVVAEVVKCFDETGSDAVFGNLLPCYLSPGDTHDHGAFRDRQLLDLSYFRNRRLFFNESIHHQTIFYRREIFDHCGYICEDPSANGEYHLHMCAFVKHGYIAKHLPKPICRFALGGKSTSNFSEEWRRYTLARDILRAKFFPNGRRIPITDRYEYHYRAPSIALRLRIRLRESPFHPLLSWTKNRWQTVSSMIRHK
jgi:glycosyltransferase involved in cell wall biosynthesis